MTTRYRARLFRFVVVELLIIFTVGIACWCQDVGNIENRPKSLIILPSAFDVKYASFEGKPQLIYSLYADYPAEPALRTISDKLRAAGWKPLKSDFLNPSIPSSHVRGWQQFEDATTKPRTTVYSWMAQWENPQHDIVSYTLEYRYSVDAKADLDTLRVLAIFIPASVAAKIPKAISQ
jgi:hypothetical protein